MQIKVSIFLSTLFLFTHFSLTTSLIDSSIVVANNIIVTPLTNKQIRIDTPLTINSYSHEKQYFNKLPRCDVNKNNQLPRIQLHKLISQIYTREMQSLLRQKKLNIGEVWVIKQLMKFDFTDSLQQLVDQQIKRLYDNDFIKLVHSKAPYYELSPIDNDDLGLKRFSSYMLAAVGIPLEKALSLIDEFTAVNGKGYVLTHQYLILVWYEQVHQEVYDGFNQRKQRILQRIYEEQQQAIAFSDLFAERFAILLHYGSPKQSDIYQWLCLMTTAYIVNDQWPLYSHTIRYDGVSVSGTPGVNHTNVLALLSMRIFLSSLD